MADHALAGLRVLITNFELWPPSGTVTYVRDLALELVRQGHCPIVYSSTYGEVAEELRAAGVIVTHRRTETGGPPDVIHGHHYAPTLKAIRDWPSVPAIHICHDYRWAEDKTPLHPHIYRHFGVSLVCVERLTAEGVEDERVELLPNFVDTHRFARRGDLPARPRRALVFSNFAHPGSYLPAVEAACAATGLELDVIGAGMGMTAAHPETMLAQYDIVFAKGKAAMEAMAVGAAVVLCDIGGVGPLVTAEAFDDLRPLNFGIQTMHHPVDAESLVREINRYDAQNAGLVCDLVRSRAGLAGAAERLTRAYRAAITEHKGDGSAVQMGPRQALAPHQSVALSMFWRWRSMPDPRRERLKRLPGLAVALRMSRRLFTPRG